MPLTDEELDRYARHIVLREIGGPGQARLRAADVLVIGAGGLGAPALMYLAAAGIGRIAIVDDDAVSLSNLQRQIIHQTPDIDRPKVVSAAETIAALNPGVDVELHETRLTEENASGLFAGRTLILEGSDNFATRYVANAAAAAAGIPLIGGAISQWEGQVSVWDPASGGPCYACIFPEPPAEGLAPSCAEAGVMGALAGVVGSMMATEAIKIIARAGAPLQGKMLLYDALWAENRVVTMKRDPACRVCGSGHG